MREGMLLECTLPEVNHNFYLTHEVKITKEPTENQKKALKFWGEDGVKID
jgi:hypothetical protein